MSTPETTATLPAQPETPLTGLPLEPLPPKGAHTLNPLRHHARTPRSGFRARMADLADRLRGHGDLPEGPDLDLQDGGDRTDIIDALQNAPEPDPWWGMTRMDNPPQMPRRYAPDPLGLFTPAVAVPDPGVQADLGSCPLFRATVRENLVRQEDARGSRNPGLPWHVRYARVYRQRTGLIPVREPDFALYRWDSVVDEIVTQSAAAAEAEWAAERAAAATAPVVCAEYTARHSAGSEEAA